MQAGDRTFSIAERAFELMKTYAGSASPRSYEVWFTYVTGLNPALNDELRRAVDQSGLVADAALDALYDAHVSPARYVDEAARVSATMMGEIDQVSELIGLGLGSAERYGETLEAAADGFGRDVDPAALKLLLGSVLDTTREVAAANRNLDVRLRESRKEIAILRRALETLRRDTIVDPLTGLGNRRHFDAVLAEAVVQTAECGVGVAVAVADLDGFTRFNEAHGHGTGDQVLRLVAAAMRNRSPADATLARLDGGTFGLILPDGGTGGALACAEAVRQDVMARELINRKTESSLGRITVSLGLATSAPSDTASAVMARARANLAAAKAAGRNRTVAAP